jgi:hypothetical protein
VPELRHEDAARRELLRLRGLRLHQRLQLKERLGASPAWQGRGSTGTEFLAAYEAEHGEITDEEIREAARSARGRAVVVRGKPEPRDQRKQRHGQRTA